MNKNLEKLFQMLDRHVRTYEKLSALLEHERTALMSRNLELVQKTTQAKEIMIKRIQEAVPVLIQAMTHVGRALGLSVTDPPVLADLASASPKPLADRFMQYSRSLANLKQRVTRQNQANHLFVQEALELFSGAIQILSGAEAATAKSGYARNGQKTAAAAVGPVKLSREV